uniref:Uncharacterized protein n=1 Tax=Rhodococcus erythropolis TaxID=1833 RepID=Q6XNA8_RHOER|nr:hypothetical protein PBD2.038 [Rhodococcus erythropolis]
MSNPTKEKTHTAQSGPADTLWGMSGGPVRVAGCNRAPGDATSARNSMLVGAELIFPYPPGPAASEIANIERALKIGQAACPCRRLAALPLRAAPPNPIHGSVSQVDQN